MKFRSVDEAEEARVEVAKEYARRIRGGESTG